MADDPVNGAPGDDEDVPLPAAGDEEPHTALPPKVESWRRRSATGAILSGFAFGVREVFEPERKDPSIVMETSGEPPQDLPVEATLDALPARHSVVRIRPWLLDRQPAADGPDGDDGPSRPDRGPQEDSAEP
ncbi:MAG: hypothetical protein ACRDXE_03065 [Acidimicrobiales bacterium]